MATVEELLTNIYNALTRAEKTQLDAPYNVNRYRHMNRNEKVTISTKPVFLDKIIVSKGGDQCLLTIWDGTNKIFKGILNAERTYKNIEVEAYTIKIKTEIQNELSAELHSPRATSHFKLNAITGSAAVDSGSIKTAGVLKNMANEDWVAGKLYNCLDFDGDNDHIDCNNVNAFDKDNPFSILFWAYQHNYDSTQYFFGKRQVTSEKGYGSFVDNAGYCYFHLLGTPNTLSNILKTKDVFAANQLNLWWHYAFTYDGSEKAEGMKIYRQRYQLPTQITDNDLGGTMVSTTDLNIGAMRGVNCFDGLIDDFRVYAEELTREQITLIYNSALGTEEEFNIADIILTYKENIIPTQSLEVT